MKDKDLQIPCDRVFNDGGAHTVSVIDGVPTCPGCGWPTKKHGSPQSDLQMIITTLGQQYQADDGEPLKVGELSYNEQATQAIEALITTKLEQAYNQGKIDEAKICEKAKRHDYKQMELEARQDQIMIDELAFTTGTDEDESVMIEIRNDLLAQLTKRGE